MRLYLYTRKYKSAKKIKSFTKRRTFSVITLLENSQFMTKIKGCQGIMRIFFRYTLLENINWMLRNTQLTLDVKKFKKSKGR